MNHKHTRALEHARTHAAVCTSISTQRKTPCMDFEAREKGHLPLPRQLEIKLLDLRLLDKEARFIGINAWTCVFKVHLPTTKSSKITE